MSTAVFEAPARLLQKLRALLLAARHRGGRVVCPKDDWAFDPRYTDGVCPLCGWQPPGAAVAPPLAMRVDWFWPAMLALVAVSVLMAVLVIRSYTG